MAKKLSSAYWRTRQHEREAKALSDIKEVEAEYKRALEVARRNISKEISRLGHSFMRENELTYAEALRKLSGAEHRSWRMEVSQYMKKYKKLLKKEPVEAQKLWIELETLSMRSRISHLDAIHAQINMELMAMGQEVATSGRDALHGIYGSTFKGVAMDLGVKTGFSADMVKAVIDRPWSGLNYSQRIWKNTDRLAAVLKQEVVTSLIQGVNLKKMESRLLKKVVGASKTDVERLLRTEVNYTMNQATLDGYKEAQVEMYIFDATIDGRTSQICAGLNGERFKLEKAVVGINYPPMHPRCRSTTEPILEEKKKAKKKKAVIEKPEDSKPKAAEKKKEEKPKEKPVKTFVPAKSIKEAEAYGQKFIGSGYAPKFKNQISYKGISLEHANAINEKLEELYKTYDLDKLSGIKTVLPTSSIGKKAFKDGADAVMAYNPIEHGIYLNAKVLKDAKSLAKYGTETKEAWDTVMDNIDKLQGSAKELALRYKRAGRSLVGGNNVGDYLTHEMGHHVQWTAIDTKTSNAITKEMSKFAEKVSGYATSNRSEYFAESFVAFHKKELDRLDPQYVTYMKSKKIADTSQKAVKTLKKLKKEGIIKEKSYDWKNLKELRSPEAVSRYFSNDPDRKAWLKGISLDEKDALKAYTGSKYRSIGAYNRKINDWAPTGKCGSIIAEARKMRIPKPPERLPGETMMEYFRRKKKVWGYGVPYGAVQAELDVKKWNAGLDALISRYDLKEDLLVYRGVDRNAMPDFKSPADLIGKPYSDPSYMSTSPVLQSTWTKEVVLKIKVPKGLGSGAYIGEISEHDDELEFLLPRGSNFKITDAKTIDISGEKIVLVEMEVDPDDGGRKAKKKSD